MSITAIANVLPSASGIASQRICKITKYIKQCLFCGKEFTTAFKTQRLCNRSCSRRFVLSSPPTESSCKDLKNINKPRKMQKRVTKVCLFCQTTFQLRHPKELRKFCNSSCSGKYRKNETYTRLYGTEHMDAISRKEFVIRRDGHVCRFCNRPPLHNNLPLVLQVDHIDGNPLNNSPVNLRLLCPNCHTQTSTYGAKKRTNPNIKYARIPRKVHIPCNTDLTSIEFSI